MTRPRYFDRRRDRDQNGVAGGFPAPPAVPFGDSERLRLTAFGQLLPVAGRGAGGGGPPWRTAGCAPLWRTAGWGYVRLHQGLSDFAYGERALRTWADRVGEAGWQDAYVYFNNDPGGAAVRNARRFAKLL